MGVSDGNYSLVPTPPPNDELTVYQVLDDLGKLCYVWREIDEASANEQAIINDILSGQFKRLLRVVAFNSDAGWSRDVTEEIAASCSMPPRKGALTERHQHGSSSIGSLRLHSPRLEVRHRLLAARRVATTVTRSECIRVAF